MGRRFEAVPPVAYPPRKRNETAALCFSNRRSRNYCCSLSIWHVPHWAWRIIERKRIIAHKTHRWHLVSFFHLQLGRFRRSIPNRLNCPSKGLHWLLLRVCASSGCRATNPSSDILFRRRYQRSILAPHCFGGSTYVHLPNIRNSFLAHPLLLLATRFQS